MNINSEDLLRYMDQLRQVSIHASLTHIPTLGRVRLVPIDGPFTAGYNILRHMFVFRKQDLVNATSLDDVFAPIMDKICTHARTCLCDALGPALGFPLTSDDLELAVDSQDDRIRFVCERTEFMYNIRTGVHAYDHITNTQSVSLELAVRVFVHKGEVEQ